MSNAEEIADRSPKVHLGVKLSPGLKRRVEDAARELTCSLSVEVETRLARSLKEQEFLGGPLVVRILDKVELAFAHAGQRAAMMEGKGADWPLDRGCYGAAMQAAIDALMFSHPDTSQEQLEAELASLYGRIALHFKKREQEK